jgi:hypothetical protein
MFETPEDRLSEIQLYELVYEELEKGEQSKGSWAKALAEGEGNIERARGLYIKLRVKMVQDEWAYAEKVFAEQTRADQSRQTALLQKSERLEHLEKTKNAGQRMFWAGLLASILTLIGISKMVPIEFDKFVVVVASWLWIVFSIFLIKRAYHYGKSR